MTAPILRCIDCRKEYSEAEAVGLEKCTACGTVSVPSLVADDVTLQINWQELRILTIWASWWAAQDCIPERSRLTLRTIISRLARQYPGKTPLTLESELQELANALDAEVEEYDGGTVRKYHPVKPS